MFGRAILFMFRCAANEQDAQLEHFLRVGLKARALYGEKAGIVGILHDLVEGGWATQEELEKQFPQEIVHAVLVLTKDEKTPYRKYIEDVCCGPLLARQVKRIDISDNLTRKPKSASHTKRYREAFEKVSLVTM